VYQKFVDAPSYRRQFIERVNLAIRTRWNSPVFKRRLAEYILRTGRAAAEDEAAGGPLGEDEVAGGPLGEDEVAGGPLGEDEVAGGPLGEDGVVSMDELLLLFEKGIFLIFFLIFSYFFSHF
jgi:hypothetical protein